MGPPRVLSPHEGVLVGKEDCLVEVCIFEQV